MSLRTRAWYVVLLLVLCIPDSALSLQLQKIPLPPVSQPQRSLVLPNSSQDTPLPSAAEQPLNVPFPFQLPQSVPSIPLTNQAVVPSKPAERSLSDFERFVSSETVEMTDVQFVLLSNFENIVFRFSKDKILPGQIAVPVKVMSVPMTEPAVSQIVNAGYLIGTPASVREVFMLLGIKSPLHISTDVRQFGYELFAEPQSAFTAAENVPVGPDYVIGPGDEVRITVWGKIEGQWSVVVDRYGNIAVPKLGIIGVTGLTFGELKDVLHREVSKYYTGFEMNVSLGSLKTIQVYLVGNALRPGAYSLSSFSTLVSALFETGGPGKGGSMRDVQLRRNGKTILHFDMYDFLIKGDKSQDMRLLPEDVIFIPPIGRVAAIAGSVHYPAIYEIKDEKTIADLIAIAGGLNTLAFKGRVQIERIVDNSRQTVFESNLDEVRDREIPLLSGDVVKIFQVVRDKKTVRLSGAVQKEGEYGYRAGMTVKDLIAMAGGLNYYAYTKEAELTRVYVTDDGPRTEKIMVDLEKAIQGDAEANISLKEDDYLFVRPVPEWRLYRIVTLSGEVKFPGNYTIKKGDRLSSLLERAGGFTEKAYLQGAVFTRGSVRDLQQQRLKESLDRLEQQMLSSSLMETQAALSAEDLSQQKIVEAQQRSLLAKLRAAKPIGRLTIRLADLDSFRGSVYDIELEDGDSIFLPETPASVNVMGSLFNPTAFIFSPDITVSDYIAMAGGMTKEADSSEIFVLKVDGTAISRQQGGFLGLQWNSQTKRIESGGFMSMKLDPGDTVIVPPELERIAWVKNAKDLTQILYQIAVTAGVLIVAF